MAAADDDGDNAGDMSATQHGMQLRIVHAQQKYSNAPNWVGDAKREAAACGASPKYTRCCSGFSNRLDSGQ